MRSTSQKPQSHQGRLCRDRPSPRLSPRRRPRGKATIEITGTEGKGATLVTVFADIPSEELEVELIFHWSNGKSPRVVDLSIDGSSLVTDYRNQFGRIIAKEGAKSLLEKIQKKLATLRQKYGA